MKQMRHEFPVCNEEEFPHGLCCAECEQEIPQFVPYRERVDSVAEDGTPLLIILCVYCAAK